MAERKVLFYDDFTADAVDQTLWNVEESEDNGDIKRYTARPENIRLEGGDLVLTARREQYGKSPYTSASVTTAGKFSFRYGRLEMRAKLPYGQGLWPAFWTMGDDYLARGDELGWPYAGEIDVMEFIGVGGEQARNDTVGIHNYGCEVYRDGRMGNNRSTGNLHWGIDRDHHKSSGNESVLEKGIYNDGYHIFAVEWTAYKIEWFVDGKKYHELAITGKDMELAFHQPHWIIVNLGLVSGWGPEVNDTTPLPQEYRIDYVKVLAPEV